METKWQALQRSSYRDPVIPTYALLTTAIFSLWLGSDNTSWQRRFFWLLPFAGSVVAGLATGILRPMALTWIAAFATATYIFGVAATATWHRVIAAMAIVVLAAGLMAHQLRGF